MNKIYFDKLYSWLLTIVIENKPCGKKYDILSKIIINFDDVTVEEIEYFLSLCKKTNTILRLMEEQEINLSSDTKIYILNVVHDNIPDFVKETIVRHTLRFNIHRINLNTIIPGSTSQNTLENTTLKAFFIDENGRTSKYAMVSINGIVDLEEMHEGPPIRWLRM